MWVPRDPFHAVRLRNYFMLMRVKTLLPNGLSTIPIKVNSVFSDGFKSLSQNPRDCPILFYIS